MRPSRFHAFFAAVLLFFFVSGACGLLYQVVWTRKLVLLFGTTAYAVSAVLSIFFLGLGAGSLWGGRLADRHKNPLQFYGLFEILIGLWALLFIGGINVGEGAVVLLLKAFGFSRGMGIVLRGLLAAAFLFVPVSLMGATLPLLAKFVNHEAEIHGLRIGYLYTLNTFGAVAGCFITGFFLIERFGYTETTLLGAAANTTIGVLAILLARMEPSTKAGLGDHENHGQSELQEDPLRGFRLSMVLLAFSISGFSMLAMEVLWTRLLAMAFLGTTYAYTTMLTALLFGIAIGSAVCSAFVDRLRKPMWGLGLVMMFAGIGCLWTATRIAALPEQVAGIATSDWETVVRGIFSLSFFALFVPTFFSGMTFPLAVKAIGHERERLGKDMGLLYSANTFGGVLGALAGGYFIIPWLGTHYGIVLLSSVLLVMGALALLACPRTPVLHCGCQTMKGQPLPPSLSSVPSTPGSVFVLVSAVLLFAYVYHRGPADVSRSLNAGYIPKDHRVLHYQEGVEGTVAVSEPENETTGTNRVLWINRVQATASIEKGVKMNRFQGTLPLLFARDPKEVLFMCFGSGITCGTLALSDFAHIDAVEICKDVLGAAPLFAQDNLGVLDRPNVQFHIDDGRNFLLTAKTAYDVITFEPMPLALAGVSTFYTAEYYRLCLEHLKTGGIVSQWVPMHSLNPTMVRSLVHTFISVFPEYCAFFVNADLFLIGSNEALRLDWAKAEQRLANPELHAALEKVGLGDPIEVLASFLMDKAALDAYAGQGESMSDDRPWAEFVAPKLVYQRTVQDTLKEVQPHLASPLKLFDVSMLAPEQQAALERRHEAHRKDFDALQSYYGGLSVDTKVLDSFLRSLELDPGDANAQYYVRQILSAQTSVRLRWGEHAELKAALERALKRMPGDPVLEALLQQVREDKEKRTEGERKAPGDA